MSTFRMWDENGKRIKNVSNVMDALPRLRKGLTSYISIADGCPLTNRMSAKTIIGWFRDYKVMGCVDVYQNSHAKCTRRECLTGGVTVLYMRVSPKRGPEVIATDLQKGFVSAVVLAFEGGHLSPSLALRPEWRLHRLFRTSWLGKKT
jgi:hypothetical protein